jgi:transposase
MSQGMRRFIGFWFMLILGIAILSLQFWKYYNNTLSFSIEESIVTIVGLSMIINPGVIIDMIKRIVNTKFGGKNE